MTTKREDDKKADDTRKANQKEFAEQAKALEGRTKVATSSGQTGPAQGIDPAVKLPVDEATVETPVEQNSHTGPAQEPVHRVNEPTAPGDPAHELEAKDHEGLHMRPKKDDTPKKALKVDDAFAEQLTAMVKRVYESLGTETMTDGSGRTWTAQYGHVNNQAAITVQVARDDDVQSTVLATSGMDLEDDKHLHKAMKALGEQVK